MLLSAREAMVVGGGACVRDVMYHIRVEKVDEADVPALASLSRFERQANAMSRGKSRTGPFC